MSVIIGVGALRAEDVERVARGGAAVELHPDGRAAMERSRSWVVSVLRDDRLIYGVNTGFGSLAQKRIDPAWTEQLSRNLIVSHAAGVGPPCPPDIARATILLRASTLARGASGCRVELVETLLAMLRRGVTPRIPQQGSCGSSGDLAPLSHLGLVVFGEGGEAWLDGEVLPGPEAMARAGLPTLRPSVKEGLAMTNGAQLTTAIAALALVDADRVVRAAEVACALSFEALRGVTRALHPAVHALRPHPGAVASAARLRSLLAGSALVDSLPGKVQSAYSLRCAPVVLGAARDVLDAGRRTVEIEVNAVTDNPVMLLDVDDPNHAFSAGLFHGEPVGMACDAMKIGVAEVASISERRIFRLTTRFLSEELPPALAGPGDLGLLFAQTTAAALVSENKALAWPASVDSIPTCEDQEDHVAMSTTAAWRLRETVANTRRVVAIELLAASRALAQRVSAGGRPAEATAAAAARVRELSADSPVLADAIERVARAVAAGAFEDLG